MNTNEENYKAAQEWYKIAKEQNNQLAIVILENHFPEFAESKDEKIRKALIEYFQVDGCICGNIPTKDIRAWLEKQGEQKPAEKIEPKFKIGDTIIHVEDGSDFIYRKHKIINVTELGYILDDGCSIEMEYEDQFELVKQKPAWGEEDDAAHTRILGAIAKAFMGVLPTKPSEEDVHWLKTLPERFNLPPKEEWSEEDQMMLKEALRMIEKPGSMFKGEILTKKVADWLKSLKPQSRWKPSDTQMEALKYQITNTYDGSWQYAATKELYNQLKKLKEK